MKVERITLGPAATNVWFVENEETAEVILTDPADAPDRIIRYVRERGLRPCGILLTHGHFDHILAVEECRRHFGIPVYANEAELALLQDVQANLSAPWVNRPTRVQPDVLLRDGEEFTLGGFSVRMIATPGHTAGSCCYYFEKEQVLLSGDTLFAGSCGRTDLPTGSTAAIVASIRDRLFVLPPNTRVYPGHGDITTIAFEQC